MNSDNRDPASIPREDIRPQEDGELNSELRDKRIFGVFKDEFGADRAIRQLYKLGYDPEEIFVFTKDLEKAEKMRESYVQDFQVMSCSDGSDFVGQSYHSGDVVICVPKEAKPLTAKPRAGGDGRAETAMDVQTRMQREREKADQENRAEENREEE